MAGLFFCLASDTVQGFYFARMQCSPTQAFTARFAVSMQLYHPRHKTAHGALQGLFLRLHIFSRPRYQTGTTSHCAACVTLENIPAPGRPQKIPDTTATPGRCTGQHRPPIIIMYIRGCRGAHLSWIHARRCSISQTMPAAAGQLLPCADRLQVLTHCQQYRPGAPAEGSASPPTQGQPGTLHPAGQSSGRECGGRRGTIGGFRRISFRAFAR